MCIKVKGIQSPAWNCVYFWWTNTFYRESKQRGEMVNLVWVWLLLPVHAPLVCFPLQCCFFTHTTRGASFERQATMLFIWSSKCISLLEADPCAEGSKDSSYTVCINVLTIVGADSAFGLLPFPLHEHNATSHKRVHNWNGVYSWDYNTAWYLWLHKVTTGNVRNKQIQINYHISFLFLFSPYLHFFSSKFLFDFHHDSSFIPFFKELVGSS